MRPKEFVEAHFNYKWKHPFSDNLIVPGRIPYNKGMLKTHDQRCIWLMGQINSFFGKYRKKKERKVAVSNSQLRLYWGKGMDSNMLLVTFRTLKELDYFLCGYLQGLEQSKK